MIIPESQKTTDASEVSAVSTGSMTMHTITGIVALQGILSTFLVRIPVSYAMSKVAGVSLFQVGFATPLATVFAIAITLVYLVRFERKSA